MNKKASFLASFNLILCFFIIIWGAWVRLSGSGAGCGDHWPLCNGEVVPLDIGLKTMIEFTHRLTSGFFGITIFASLILGFKTRKEKPYFFKATLWAFVLTIVEALIGALLVKKGLVVDDSSILRGWVISLHLINTFLLLASLCASLYFAREDVFVKKELPSKDFYLALIIILLFMLLGASGAITALGDLLFPAKNLIDGIAQDFDTSSHLFIKLRLYHPIIAVLTMSLFYYLLLKWEEHSLPYGLKTSYIQALIILSLGFGILNLALLAPTWGALVHLFLADILWCSLSFRILSRYFSKS